MASTTDPEATIRARLSRGSEERYPASLSVQPPPAIPGVGPRPPPRPPRSGARTPSPPKLAPGGSGSRSASDETHSSFSAPEAPPRVLYTPLPPAPSASSAHAGPSGPDGSSPAGYDEAETSSATAVNAVLAIELTYHGRLSRAEVRALQRALNAEFSRLVARDAPGRDERWECTYRVRRGEEVRAPAALPAASGPGPLAPLPDPATPAPLRPPQRSSNGLSPAVPATPSPLRDSPRVPVSPTPAEHSFGPLPFADGWGASPASPAALFLPYTPPGPGTADPGAEANGADPFASSSSSSGSGDVGDGAGEHDGASVTFAFEQYSMSAARGREIGARLRDYVQREWGQHAGMWEVGVNVVCQSREPGMPSGATDESRDRELGSES